MSVQSSSRPAARLPSWMQALFAVTLGPLAICLGAWITVPMVPVPMTLQTLAVMLVGGCLRPGWAVLTVLAYLSAGILGLPVFADFTAAPGRAFLELPSGGYLLGFLPAVCLVSFVARQGTGLRLLLAMFAAHLVILILGTARLTKWLGGPAAFEHGFTPFLVGAGAKSLLAYALIRIERKRVQRGPWRSNASSEPSSG